MLINIIFLQYMNFFMLTCAKIVPTSQVLALNRAYTTRPKIAYSGCMKSNRSQNNILIIYVKYILIIHNVTCGFEINLIM